MPANPEILSALNEHVYNKTGKRVLDLSAGDPPTGGDKGKDGKGTKPAPAAATPITPPDKIPLPDYNDPKSRLDYVNAFREKHGKTSLVKRGDAILRFNETPAWGSAPLKELATKAAKQVGLDPTILYSSMMEEGASGLLLNKGTAHSTGNKDYPVSGAWSFGLDSFPDRFKELQKKGYLDKDFDKNFIIGPDAGYKDPTTQGTLFKTTDAGIKASAAMMRAYYDELDDYAKKKGIPLNPDQRNFFALAHFNSGNHGYEMLDAYNKAGLLKDNSFMTKMPNIPIEAFNNFYKGDTKKAGELHKQIYENIAPRLDMARGFKAENLWGDQAPQPQQSQQQTPLFQSNKKAFVDSVLQSNKHLDWVQRLYEKNAPSIQLKGQPDRSTHFMGDDGNGYVFPTVVRQNGKLVYLGDKAEDYARETKTGIQFPKEQGDWFANNGYKLGTNVNNAIGPNGVPFHNPRYQLQQ